MLTLANGANTVTVANVESVSGGTGVDTVTLSAELTSASNIDLAGGKDSLTLGNFDERRLGFERRDADGRLWTPTRSPTPPLSPAAPSTSAAATTP